MLAPGAECAPVHVGTRDLNRCRPAQIDEVQQLDGAEPVRGRAVELLPVRRTAGHRRDGHLEERLQHQRVLHIRRQPDDRAGQRNAKVRLHIFNPTLCPHRYRPFLFAPLSILGEF